MGDCQKLLEHLPQSDVKFKAGFNVRGKKVKVADYKGRSVLKLKDTMNFDFAIDIARKYNLSKKDLNGHMALVMITIKDERVYLNNNLITKKDQSELAARCQSILNLK